MIYYLIENDEKTGPFTIEELDKKEIYKTTLIWTKGLDEWTEAKNIPMLKEIIDKTPPKYNSTKNNTPPKNPNTSSSSSDYFGYELAARWERFIASFIESLIYLVPMLILMDDNYLSIQNIIISIIAAILVGGLMYPNWSGNLGHKILGLKVISKENGEDFKDVRKSIGRELYKNLLGYLIIPLIWLLWDRDKQNLYDKLSKTIVVRKGEN